MAVNTAALKVEIGTAPYAGLNDLAIATLINTKNIPVDADTSQESILRTLVARRIFGKIVARIEVIKARITAALIANAAADVSAFEARLVTLINAMRAFETLPSFQMATPAINTFVSGMLDDLITEGALVAGDKTALMNIAKTNISRAEQLFGRGVIVENGHVARARL